MLQLCTLIQQRYRNLKFFEIKYIILSFKAIALFQCVVFARQFSGSHNTLALKGQYAE